jgi:hypothetical protein
MQFYIPEISDEIRLLTDWHFNLYNEERNATLMRYAGDTRPCGYNWTAHSHHAIGGIPYSIPAGEILVIDRLYVRKGQDDFSSLTFLWKGKSNAAYTSMESRWGGAPIQTKHPKRQVRFWAKLDDVNKIEYEKV